MNKLVVIAEKEEFGLIDKLHLNGIPVLVTGVGAINIISALKDIPRDTEIINVGYAGSKNLAPDTFYGVSTVTLYHPNVSYQEPKIMLSRENMIPFVDDYAECLTGCDFVLESDKKDCLFDMELAYIASLGFERVRAYKYVSDNLDLQEYRSKLNA